MPAGAAAGTGAGVGAGAGAGDGAGVGTGARSARSVVHDHRRDSLIDFARNVVVALPQLVGRFVSVQLFFDAPWLLVSEVRFESGALTSFARFTPHIASCCRHSYSLLLVPHHPLALSTQA